MCSSDLNKHGRLRHQEIQESRRPLLISKGKGQRKDRMQKEAGVRGKGRSARWWRHGEKGRGEEWREGRGVN